MRRRFVPNVASANRRGDGGKDAAAGSSSRKTAAASVTEAPRKGLEQVAQTAGSSAETVTSIATCDSGLTPALTDRPAPASSTSNSCRTADRSLSAPTVIWQTEVTSEWQVTSQTDLSSTLSNDADRAECAPAVAKPTGLLGRRRPVPNLSGSRRRHRVDSASCSTAADKRDNKDTVDEPLAKRICRSEKTSLSPENTGSNSSSAVLSELSSTHVDLPVQLTEESTEAGESIAGPGALSNTAQSEADRQPAQSEADRQPASNDEATSVTTRRATRGRKRSSVKSNGENDDDLADAKQARAPRRGRPRKQARTEDPKAVQSEDGNVSAQSRSSGKASGNVSSEKTKTSSQKSLQKSKQKSRSRILTEAPEPTKVTMRELIHRNPIANKMSCYTEKAKTPTKNTDKPPSTPSANVTANSSRASSPVRSTPAMAPQVRVTADGRVVIDEESLMIPTTESLQDNVDREVVYETANTATYASFSKRSPIDRWTQADTEKFFGALQQVGTDFSLMKPLFPARSRRQLKNKFKKEERQNPGKIAQALRDIRPIDPDLFFKKPAEDPLIELEDDGVPAEDVENHLPHDVNAAIGKDDIVAEKQSTTTPCE